MPWLVYAQALEQDGAFPPPSPPPAVRPRRGPAPTPSSAPRRAAWEGSPQRTAKDGGLIPPTMEQKTLTSHKSDPCTLSACDDSSRAPPATKNPPRRRGDVYDQGSAHRSRGRDRAPPEDADGRGARASACRRYWRPSRPGSPSTCGALAASSSVTARREPDGTPVRGFQSRFQRKPSPPLRRGKRVRSGCMPSGAAAGGTA